MKQFACGDVVAGCDARFEAATDEAILELVAVHASADHGMASVPDTLVKQVTDNITFAP